MAPSEPPVNTCPCPKFSPLPTCTYHEDLEKPNTVDITSLYLISNSAPVNTCQPIVWVLGGPGAGKSTQCEMIVAKYGFTHLSTGELLRAEVECGSERSKYLTAIMDQGGLVPNEVVLCLLKEAIEIMEADSNGFLLDGYPRERCQAITFEETIASPTAILYFEVSDATLTQRLLDRAPTSDRTDDNEATIKQRLKVFLDNNQDLLDQYPNLISRINAESSREAIFAEVEKVLDPIVAAYLDSTPKHFVNAVNMPMVSEQQKAILH
ncbi:hypothetical protein PYW08_001280 [Mythimna loreyi]|uniref:Uncharacterized protein n=1 Tax=Mythimna loreyi TaxID=667449 RepID=A0ACC2R2B8_9NEOP|nr:hypothetical protein PYW08_001280 [Mythimna loreyi]